MQPVYSSPKPAKPSARKPKKPAPSAADLEDVSDTTTQVQVYLMPWAIKTARALAREEGLTNADIAYDAIDASGDSLRDLVRIRVIDRRPDGSAFPGRSTRRRPRHGSSGGARALWSLQATPKEREVLERLAHDTGAESISQLVSTAVESFLEDRRVR